MNEDIFKENTKPRKGKRATYWMSADVLDKLEELTVRYSISKSEIIKRLVMNVEVK